jgi:hypothetical protein
MASVTDRGWFVPKQTYEMTFASNSEAVTYFTVTKRTAKFVTLEDSDGKQTRVGIHVRDNAEFCMPFGRYSMAPVLCSTRSLEAEVV